jgi:hypothetical protein
MRFAKCGDTGCRLSTAPGSVCLPKAPGSVTQTSESRPPDLSSECCCLQARQGMQLRRRRHSLRASWRRARGRGLGQGADRPPWCLWRRWCHVRRPRPAPWQCAARGARQSSRSWPAGRCRDARRRCRRAARRPAGTWTGALRVGLSVRLSVQPECPCLKTGWRCASVCLSVRLSNPSARA